MECDEYPERIYVHDRHGNRSTLVSHHGNLWGRFRIHRQSDRNDIETYQGEELAEDRIALTIKHFPGGDAQENGYDPHYKEGKYNVYPTPGSLEKISLTAFYCGVKKQPASIMPYYAIPSNDKTPIRNPLYWSI